MNRDASKGEGFTAEIAENAEKGIKHEFKGKS